LSASVIAWLWVNPPLPSPSIGAGENPRNVVAVNLVDLVVQGAGAVSVLLNQGKGNFEDGVWTPLPSPGYCAAGADFNGDGKPDVAVKYRAGRIHTAGDRVGQSPVHGGPILNPKQCRLPACRRFERRSYPRTWWCLNQTPWMPTSTTAMAPSRSRAPRRARRARAL
jgi:hypothetical protein